MPRFATLPRPACAKVLRVTAAFARARSLRKVVSAAAHEKFARSIAPRVLCAVQRDRRGEHDDTDFGAALNVFDRADMTAAGLCLALHTIGDPNLRVLVQLRLPRTLARRAAHFTVGDMSARAARDLLDTAYTLAGGEPC
ncbi:Bacterial type III secretion protein (HrpB4) [Paraburkholderia caribensis MBA4]|uniref:Bacterial type III secretion protein (HrpB4) n=1 Tax=Paraburkholderia caribensis MBA4 TaxID=1323664 RepID=A0A0P0RDB6_9BURK|nr:Bacterial type III secretion protein (HrpB4) [Paraburkholderia caribensis MBA4]